MWQKFKAYCVSPGHFWGFFGDLPFSLPPPLWLGIFYLDWDLCVSIPGGHFFLCPWASQDTCSFFWLTSVYSSKQPLRQDLKWPSWTPLYTAHSNLCATLMHFLPQQTLGVQTTQCCHFSFALPSQQPPSLLFILKILQVGDRHQSTMLPKMVCFMCYH